jgi:succinate-semialdehyde dehydrogenase/glutarate-semialdehyde dehydrogenase
MTTQYLETLHHLINGVWAQPTSGESQTVVNPATNKPIGRLGHASRADLDRAIAAAEAGFVTWRRVSAFERSKILRKAAELMRQRAERIATMLTLEQGKLLAEAKIEVMGSADVVDWFAEEGRRA